MRPSGKHAGSRRCRGAAAGGTTQLPVIERIIGDAGYQGRKMETAVACTGTWKLQIVRRCDQHRFVVLPKEDGIVERTLAWVSRCRRLARDYERHARKAAAFVRLPRHDPPQQLKSDKPIARTCRSRLRSSHLRKPLIT